MSNQMACTSAPSQTSNSTDNKANNIDNQDGPRCATTDKLHVSPVLFKLFGTRVCHGGGPSNRWTVWVSCGPTQTAGVERRAPFMSMWMSTAAPATKNLPPDPLASRGQKNRRRKNTLHNTLCNERPKLIAGVEKRKNREIMSRPFSIVLSSWHEGHNWGLRGVANRNANCLSRPESLRGTI